jgi:large subunit ribosomal protein L24
MKIQKGDLVKVISGKDSGKQGKVLQAFPKKGTVLVEGVNITKKHQKRQEYANRCFQRCFSCQEKVRQSEL